jgi:Flp pilus assembly protein TadD
MQRRSHLDPQDAAAYYNRGLAYHEKGDLDRAIADFDQALALDPQAAEAYNNRGTAYYDKGDLDHAGAALRPASSISRSTICAPTNSASTRAASVKPAREKKA